MPFLRHHFDIEVIAVKPIVKSIITMIEPSSFANSARSYICSMSPAVMFR